MSVYAIYFSPTRGTEKIRQKLHTAETYEKLALPGGKPYRTYQGVPLKPKADKHCTACGLCARVCPAGAIPGDNPKKTDKSKCISCMPRPGLPSEGKKYK